MSMSGLSWRRIQIWLLFNVDLTLLSWYNYSIKEDFGNGKYKTSIYLNDGTTSCLIDDNGKGKQYDFNKNGNIIRCFDYSR